MNKLKNFTTIILLFSILFCFPVSKASATSTYLNLTSSPTGAVVYLNNRPTSYVTPCTITGLTSGYTYGLHLEKSGYSPLDTSFIAGSIASLSLTLAPALSNSFMNFETFPSGASVYLKDLTGGTAPSLIGVAPCTLNNLTPKVSYTIIFEKVGYISETVSLKAVAGGSTQTMSLRVSAAPTNISLTTLPSGAIVYLNGTLYSSPTPCTIAGLTVGITYHLHFDKPNYTSIDKDIIAGTDTSLALTLESSTNPYNSSLTIATDPTGANVYLDNNFVGISSFTVSNLMAGKTYNLRVEKEGYTSITKNVIAKNPASVEFITLKPAEKTTFNIYLGSTPAGAQITLDGVFYGHSPYLVGSSPCTFKAAITGTIYTFTFSKKGYISQTVQITAKAADANLSVALKKELVLNITSSPAGANIYINDVKQPKLTPCKITGYGYGAVLNLTIRKEGYQPFYQTFSTWNEGTSNITTKLLMIPGIYLTSFPSGADVYLDGAQYRSYTTPCTITGFAINTTHTLRLEKTGYAPVTKTVKMPSGHLPVFLKLSVIRQAIVNIKSSPSGASVFINKIPSGLTPDKMFIAPLQTITIVAQKEGYVTQTKTIYLENGKNYTWVANLKKVH